MGARFPSVFVSTTAVATGSGGEVVGAVTPQLTLPYDGAAVFIMWQLIIPHGAVAITPAFNVRRGAATTGALVLGSGTLAAPAANAVVQYSGIVVDTAAGAAQPQYSICVSNVNSGTSVSMTNLVVIAFAL